VDRALVQQLGFSVVERAEGGRSGGAWSATAPDGAPVVLKWSTGAADADRWSVLLAALDELRARGAPVAEHQVFTGDGWTLTAQEALPGSSADIHPAAVVAEVVRCTEAMQDVACPLRPPDGLPWGESVVRTLTVGDEGWAAHDPLRAGGRRSAALLSRVRAVGAETRPAELPTTGLVHLDLHTDNVLVDDGRLTGIIDWDGACGGDPRFDLVRYAFDLDGHGQDVWDVVGAAGVEPRVLRAYAAHHALRCTSWALRHQPADVARQLARAERVLDRVDA
jgi:aminoglycoside phosphotransferase (APT) family kinase protein